MDSTRILLIGILYLAQLVVSDIILNERMLSEDGKPISCGSRWKKTGVKYQIYYPPKDQETEEGDISAMPEGSEVPEDLQYLEGDEGDSVSSTETEPESPSDSGSQKVYEYCMEENTYRVFYTKYEIENPVKMTPSTSELRKRGPFEKQLLETFSLKESKTRDYYENIADYDSQRVVVPDFSPQLKLRDGFFRYDISAPLNGELTNPWKEVINEIKAKIHKINEPIHVYSGTYDTYRLHGVIYYINPLKNILPAPFSWWILLYNEKKTKGISVIMQNYAFSNGETKHLLCEKSICSDVGLKMPDYSYSHIYCCPAQTILDEYDFTDEEINDLFDFRDK